MKLRRLSISQKIKSIAALLLVFLLVLATNLADSTHFGIVKNSLETIYEDRLVAKNHLFKIADLLHNKHKAVYTLQAGQSQDDQISANESIQELLEKYASTNLTEKEALYFESLKANLNQLYQQEALLIEPEIVQDKGFMTTLDVYYKNIRNDLEVLSDIQLIEAKRQLHYSNRAVATSDLIARLEIGTLIFIGLIVQFLIFFRPSE